MACTQKKKAASLKKKTSAKVASPQGEKPKEDAIINHSQTGSPLRKFSKNLLEYRPSWEVNGGFRIAIKNCQKPFVWSQTIHPKSYAIEYFKLFLHCTISVVYLVSYILYL